MTYYIILIHYFLKILIIPQLVLLDKLLAMDIKLAFGGNFSFASFEIELVLGSPRRQNNFDYGVLTMWSMQELSERKLPINRVSNLHSYELYKISKHVE